MGSALNFGNERITDAHAGVRALFSNTVKALKGNTEHHPKIIDLINTHAKDLGLTVGNNPTEVATAFETGVLHPIKKEGPPERPAHLRTVDDLVAKVALASQKHIIPASSEQHMDRENRMFPNALHAGLFRKRRMKKIRS